MKKTNDFTIVIPRGSASKVSISYNLFDMKMHGVSSYIFRFLNNFVCDHLNIYMYDLTIVLKFVTDSLLKLKFRHSFHHELSLLTLSGELTGLPVHGIVVNIAILKGCTK